MVGMLQFKKVHNLLVIVILQGLVSRLFSTVVEREREEFSTVVEREREEKERKAETEKHVMLLTI